MSGKIDFQNREVFVEKKSITLFDFKTKWDEGDIETNPDYQRDYVYTEKQASKLVESILMGIPIPTVYLSQEQDETYKKEVLSLPREKRVSVEIQSTFGWERYADHQFGVNRFGYSGKAKDVYAKLGFTVEGIVKLVESIK